MNTESKLYMLDCESRNLSKRTLEINKQILTEFARYTGVPLSEVTANQIREYLTYKTSTTSKATAKRHYQTLSPFFKWCMDEELLESNPMVKVSKPKAPQPIIEPLSDEAMSKLIEATSGRDFLSVRNRLVLNKVESCG